MVWHVVPSARQYINDAFGLYDTIGYPCEHQSLANKKEAYRQSKRSFRRVEGANAELRHSREIARSGFPDLARLLRKSRCFSRSGAQEPLLLSPDRGTVAGGGSVRAGLEPSAAVPAGLPQSPEQTHRFHHTNLDNL